jgi:homoserine dehydrogenase
MGAQPIKIGLLGCGVVGSEVARQVLAHSADLAARVGAPLEIVGVAVRDGSKIASRAAATGLDASLFTTDAAALVARGDLDVVVEVMGGIEPTRTLLVDAMRHGAAIVSANKALLAEDGQTLHAAAAEAEVDLYFEAAVAGAIPLLRPMRESLAGDEVRRVLGIVNGTTNFILTRMDETGAAFEDALAEATALGYAEADPTADVEGHDAAAKAAILAGIAFHSRVTIEDVHCEGITAVTAATVASARAMGRVIKLLAIAEVSENAAGERGIGVRVHPAMLPRTHPLAAVREAYNAVFVEAVNAGELMFYGAGAGGAPTASAVLGDLVAVARHRVTGARGPGESTYASLPIHPVGDARTRYYVSLDVADRTGVLAQVATTFTKHGVSIQNVRQEGHGDDAALVIVTHVATDTALASTVAELRTMDNVRAIAGVMRVEGEAGP